MKNNVPKVIVFIVLLIALVSAACGGSSSPTLSDKPDIPSGSFVIEAGSGSELLLSKESQSGNEILKKIDSFPLFYSTNKVKNHINEAKERIYSDAHAFVLESPHWTNLSGQTFARSEMILGVNGDTMRQLGYTPGQPTYISTQQMVDLIYNNQLNVDFCNPTQCNSGNLFYVTTYSHYSGMGVLDNSSVNDSNVSDYSVQMTDELMKRVNITTSTDADAKDAFLNNVEGYNAIWTYEADVADINLQRTSKGQEPIYVIYVDGSIDAAQTLYFSPYYIPTADESDPKSPNYNAQFVEQYKQYMDKFKEISAAFEKDPEIRDAIAKSGWRPVQYQAQPSQDVLRPEWGFVLDPQTSTGFAPKYEVAMSLNSTFTEVIRDPVIIMYINDQSGSMTNYIPAVNSTGKDQLINASYFIFGPEAETEFLQAIEPDITKVYLFDDVCTPLETVYGTGTLTLAEQTASSPKAGNTSMFRCGVDALKEMSQYKSMCETTHKCAFVFMTDGEDNDCESYNPCIKSAEFNGIRTGLGLDFIPVYGIPLGNANEDQMKEINNIDMCHDSLIDCFKKIKGSR